MAQPNLFAGTAFDGDCFAGYGSGYGWWDAYTGAPANGIIFGGNPPYTATDFLAIYPKFFGTPAILSGTVALDGNSITGLSDPTGVIVGQLITGSGIPSGATVSSVSGTTIGISLTATAALTQPQQVLIYTAPFVPLGVINLYIAAALASIMQTRWQELFQIGVGLYVAHFLTLWLQSDGSAYTTPGQAAASGLAFGITVSEAAGDVSHSSQLLTFDAFGTFALTIYGATLSTYAMTVGMGGIYVR
jgi:hypothetical protein